MDTPETFAVEDGPQNDRAEAEQLHQLAQGVFGQIGYMNATAVETAARTPIERLAEARLLMLEAIYRELRHGHDQVTAQTAGGTSLYIWRQQPPGRLNESRRLGRGHPEPGAARSSPAPGRLAASACPVTHAELLCP